MVRKLLFILCMALILGSFVGCSSGQNEAVKKFELEGEKDFEGAIAFIINNPSEEEINKISNLKTYEANDSNESFLVIPKNNNSSIKIYGVDPEGKKDKEEVLFKTDNTSNNYALHVKATRPEGVPSIRIVIQSNGVTGEYYVIYNGKDGTKKIETITETQKEVEKEADEDNTNTNTSDDSSSSDSPNEKEKTS